jgi:hypothetical protein
MLRTSRLGDQIPVGDIFSAPVHTGTTQPPVQWVPGLFPGGKAAEGGVIQRPPSSPEVKERIQLYLHSLLGLHDHF